MKSLFSALILILSIYTVSAQQGQQAVTSLNMPVDEATGLITFKEVIQQEGSQDTLYNRGASWLHVFYSNPWEVAKVRDQSSGLIKIQHQFPIYDYDELGVKTDAGMILYNAKIEFKENRYRIQIDNFVYKQLSRYPVEKWLDTKASDYNPKWQGYLSQINTFSNDLINSLKEKMLPPKQFKKEDW
jgi:hypothetical protein